MIIVADSGSTKCDWRLIQDNGTIHGFSTIGFNPFFHDEAFIERHIRKEEQLTDFALEVKNIYFYCAGGSSEDLKAKVARGLARVFSKADIVVDHDLNAAALSVYDGRPCIACILGTGSNSCYFDGHTLSEEVPALAYILGDEGSGSYFGKILLRKFLYGQLPEHIHNCLAEQYNLDKQTIFENVYMKPHANVYLASIMKMVSLYRDDPFMRDMLREGLNRFLREHVCCFANHKEVPVHFVGSIGHYFGDILREEAAKLGITVGTISKKPIEGLVRFHQKAPVAQP